MGRFLIVVLSGVVVAYFFLAEVGEPVDLTAPVASAPEPVANSGTPDDPDPSTASRAPTNAAQGNETLTPSDRYIAPPLTTERKFATVAYGDERIAELRRLADYNMAQLYTVLWQTLDVEELDDADFRTFVLATLEERGDHAPGEVLAALIQTAPTSALRQSALRLLAEASQELSLDPFNQALDDPNLAIRRSALAFFDELNADALLDAVAYAVLDRNQAVRLHAFSTLEEMYKFAPVWEIADLVIDDPDPRIRMRALELLTYGDRQAAIDRLVLALGDPNPKISELAAALLADLEQDPS